jgi:hypothetical protein
MDDRRLHHSVTCTTDEIMQSSLFSRCFRSNKLAFIERENQNETFIIALEKNTLLTKKFAEAFALLTLTIETG